MLKPPKIYTSTHVKQHDAWRGYEPTTPSNEVDTTSEGYVIKYKGIVLSEAESPIVTLSWCRFKCFSVFSVKAPFRCEIFWLLATVALSFVFGKNCPIMDYLGLKDSSRDFSMNCAISFFFHLHLILHACAARFDVTRNLENFLFLACI